MKQFWMLLTALLLGACGEGPAPSETPVSKDSPTETVESLLANPERLKALRKQCRINRGDMGDKLCNTVGEANTRAFLGDGKVPYTPPKETSSF